MIRCVQCRHYLSFLPNLRVISPTTCVDLVVKFSSSLRVIGLQEAVDRCCKLIRELLMDPTAQRQYAKRNGTCSSSIPQSPVGVLEADTLLSCASESTHGSPEGSPSVGGVTASALKKRKLDELCDDLYTLESL